MSKVAMITGASRGIGFCVAERLASKGYDLALIARNEQTLSSCADRLSSAYGVKVSCYALDVADSEAVKQAVDTVVKDFSRIDVLFNNAGIAHRGTTELSIDDFEAMIRVNLLGAFYVAKYVADVMKQKQSGYIFNLGSRSALQARAGMGGYSASKFGLRGFAEAMARELAPYNIKVTSLHPGWVNTDMTKNLDTVSDDEKIQPEDIADIVSCFLALSSHAHVRDILIEPRAVL